MLLAVVTVAALAAGFTVAFRQPEWEAAWSSRGIYAAGPTVPDGLFGALLGGLAFVYTLSVPAAAVFTSAGWLLAFSTRMDLSTGRIPREPCWAVLFTGLVAAASTGSWAGAASTLVIIVCVTVTVTATVVLSRGGFGSGDARLLLAVTPTAWFTGVTAFLAGLLLACLLQAVFRVTRQVMPVHTGYAFAPALALGLAAAWQWGLLSNAVTWEWAGILPPA